MNHQNTITPAIVDAMTRGYLECAEWADKPEGSSARFSNAQKDIARAVCATFCDYVPGLIVDAIDAGMRPGLIGHCFWLTRCGHGTGFWDEDILTDVKPSALPALRDRDNKPHGMDPGSDSLGDALSAAADGTAGAISPFAYPSMLAYGGWLTIEGSAEHALQGHASPWEFWQAWADAHPTGAPNLDAMPADDLMSFWRKHQGGRGAGELFPMVRQGRKLATAALANYASNKATATGCRARGDISAALMYEGIADRIYSTLPAWARW